MEVLRSEDLEVAKVTGLIYGQPGAGKTTALAKITKVNDKKTLVIDIDNSSAVLRGEPNIAVVKIGLDMTKWVECVEWLENGAYKDYGLICIDNLTELEHQMLTAYGRIGKNDGAPELGHYNKTQFKIVDYVRRLRQLPVDVLFTCWEDMKEVVHPDGTKYSMLVPRLSGKSVDVVCGLCNMVARIEMGKEERFFRLESSKTYYAKDQIYKRKYCALEDLIIGSVPE
jgi:phage nucleotide-binding protein